MVSPVLEKGATSVKALFPPGTWYNLFDTTKVVISKDDRYVTLDAPLNEVNVHLYQNTIIPMQRGGMVTKEARTTPFTLLIAFPSGATKSDAKGKVYVDDDERPEMKLVDGEATYAEFYANVEGKTVKVWSEVEMGKFSLTEKLLIEKITVLGLEGIGEGMEMEVDGERVSDLSSVHFTDASSVDSDELNGRTSRKSVTIEVTGLALPLGKKFSLSWNMNIKA